MTKRDQVLRAWIDRASPKENWQSNISHKGKVHTKTTHTRNRKAAREFCSLHLAEYFSPKPPPPPTEHQPNLL